MDNTLEDFLLNTYGPTPDLIESRVFAFKTLQSFIGSVFPSSQVALYGSFPLKTFLKSGDIDITVITGTPPFPELPAYVLTQLKEKLETSPIFSEVTMIPASVPTLKLNISSISADITVNQISGIKTAIFFEEISKLFPIFNKSVILIKIWAIHFARIQGAVYGNFSTYALEILVLFILNTQGQFSGPLEVLKAFINFFAGFDWSQRIVSVSKAFTVDEYISLVTRRKKTQGRVAEIAERLGGSSEYRLMAVREVNIVDPFESSNNLGKGVGGINLERIKEAFLASREILKKEGVRGLFGSKDVLPSAQVVAGSGRNPLVLVGKENRRRNNEDMFKGSYKKTQESFRRNFRVLLENTQKLG